MARREMRLWTSSERCELACVTSATPRANVQCSTGLQISTYFSGIKVKWMIDHDDAVREAHENDDLLFGTIESWIVYVSPSMHLPILPLLMDVSSRTSWAA